MREYYAKYLPKEVYKRTLSVARSYYDDLKSLKEIEDDNILNSPDGTSGGKSGHIGDPTYQSAQNIIKYQATIRKRTDAVKKVLSSFPPAEQKIIISNIMNNKPLKISDNTSERAGQRIRHDFLIDLAAELGEIF